MSKTVFASIAATAAMLVATNARADVFVDVGLHSTRVEADVATFPRVTTTESGLHLGVGVRRELTGGSIGARAELENIDGDLLLAVRALDYRRHLSQRLAVTAFLGAARLDLATPAYGYYLGGGVMWRDVLPQFDIGIEARYADKVARDKLLPSDPVFAQRNDIFYDVKSLALYLSLKW